MEGKCQTLLYFAYGEHMNEKEMLRDVPEARMAGMARLPGFTLCFIGRDGMARAALEPSAHDSVPGRVWSLFGSSVETLDRIAGVPFFARREIRQVMVDGMKLPMLVYITAPGQQRGRPGFVTYQLMWEAYAEAGENAETLKEIAMRCSP